MKTLPSHQFIEKLFQLEHSENLELAFAFSCKFNPKLNRPY